MNILVVEDDPLLARTITRSLNDEGHEVELCLDGKSALRNALSNNYDSIVLDLMLPELSGWTVLQELRKHKETPVLILSALDQVENRVKGLEDGADDYLIKPFHVDELLARVSVIGRRAQANSDTVEIGEVTLNVKKREFYYQDSTVALTSREFALVNLLLENRGRPVDRNDIHDTIFGQQEAAKSNVVDVYVSAIRSKTHKDIIKTVRGKGYIIP